MVIYGEKRKLIGHSEEQIKWTLSTTHLSKKDVLYRIFESRNAGRRQELHVVMLHHVSNPLLGYWSSTFQVRVFGNKKARKSN